MQIIQRFSFPQNRFYDSLSSQSSPASVGVKIEEILLILNYDKSEPAIEVTAIKSINGIASVSF